MGAPRAVYRVESKESIMPVNYKAMWNKLIGKPSNKHNLPLDEKVISITLRETVYDDWDWTVHRREEPLITGYERTINLSMARAIRNVPRDHIYHIKIHYRTKVT